MLSRVPQEVQRLVRFGGVGASGLVVGLTVLNLGMLISGRFMLANFAAFIVAVTWNFSLNRRFTFEPTGRWIGRQWAEFVLGSLGGAVVNWSISVSLYTSVDFFRDHYNAAALLGVAASAGGNFLWSRWVVFREEDEAGVEGGIVHEAA